MENRRLDEKGDMTVPNGSSIPLGDKGNGTSNSATVNWRRD